MPTGKKKKEKHKLKVENYVFFGRQIEDLRVRISDGSEGWLFRGKEGARLWQGAGVATKTKLSEEQKIAVN